MGNLLSVVGPVGVTWFDTTGGTDLGKTEGDATFSFTQEFAEIKHDQDGVGAVDGVITGATMEVVTPFSELHHVNLDKLLAQSTLTAKTGQLGVLSVKGGVGVEMYAGAYQLELARYVDGLASTEDDDILRILKAFPIPDFELVYGKEGQRVVNVRWICLPSQDTGDLGVYYRLGAAS